MNDDPKPILNKRSAPRVSVTMRGVCLTSSGRSFNVSLSDISTEGCGINIGHNYLFSEEWVSIRTPKLEGLAAVVRWSTGESAGVSFERPLYEPVFDHLAKLYGRDTD